MGRLTAYDRRLYVPFRLVVNEHGLYPGSSPSSSSVTASTGRADQWILFSPSHPLAVVDGRGRGCHLSVNGTVANDSPTPYDAPSPSLSLASARLSSSSLMSVAFSGMMI